MKSTPLLSLTSRLKSWAIFPFRLLVEIAVILIDTMLSRYVIAGAIVGVVWIPCHFLFDASFKAWMWPTLVLGLCLIGLWEGCHMFEIRPYLANLVLIPPEPWQVKGKSGKCEAVDSAEAARSEDASHK
jgi:hypothetical protein